MSIIEKTPKGEFFLVKIKRASKLTVQNSKVDTWYADLIGKDIYVKKTDWNGAYYEAQNGNSVLKKDVEVSSIVMDTHDLKSKAYMGDKVFINGIKKSWQQLGNMVSKEFKVEVSTNGATNTLYAFSI